MWSKIESREGYGGMRVWRGIDRSRGHVWLSIIPKVAWALPVYSGQTMGLLFDGYGHWIRLVIQSDHKYDDCVQEFWPDQTFIG